MLKALQSYEPLLDQQMQKWKGQQNPSFTLK